MNLREILKLLAGTILTLFCGVLLVLRFDFLLGGALTVLLGAVALTLAIRYSAGLDRFLRLLLLPLLGPANRTTPVEPGAVYSFLNIELDRRERTAAVSACMAAAAVHAARLAGGRAGERGRAAAAAVLRHNFGLAFQSEWIAYVAGRTDSLLATMEPAGRERSLDEVITLCLGMLPAQEARHKSGRFRETRALLFVLIYQSLLIDGTAVDGEGWFERLGRRHGLESGEIEANKAAGRYYLHAFRHRRPGENESRNGGRADRKRSKTRKAGSGQNKKSAEAPAPAAHSEATGELLRLFDLQPGYDHRALERAWKRLLHSYHPDRHHGGDEKSRDAVHEEFLRMKHGYEILQKNLETVKTA